MNKHACLELEKLKEKEAAFPTELEKESVWGVQVSGFRVQTPTQSTPLGNKQASKPSMKR